MIYFLAAAAFLGALAFFGLLGFFAAAGFFAAFFAGLAGVLLALPVAAADAPVEDFAAFFGFDAPADFFLGDAAFFLGLFAFALPAAFGLAAAFALGLAKEEKSFEIFFYFIN